MADPISTASGVLALAVFALKSSQVLYQTVASFQSNQRIVRELREELEALDAVLQALRDTATNTDPGLTMLSLPLFRCGNACKDFEAVIVKCTAHSNGSRTSFRDWAKLRYMGDDISGFKNMLAGYKSTVIIALGDANIRLSVVTAQFLEEYKAIITNTTSDLEEHLQEIDNKLQSLSLQSTTISDEQAAERGAIQEEKDSTQQCLGICAQVSAHIDQAQPNSFEKISTATGSQNVDASSKNPSWARVVTADTFKECKEKISNATTQLEVHLQDIDNRLRNLHSTSPETPNEQAAEKEQIKAELDSIKQCLAICADASTQANKERTNLFEDVTMSDDSRQVIVSTIGDLITARRITAGDRSLQCLGQMSDDSVQQISQSHLHIATGKPQGLQAASDAPFENRYGTGVKLA
ncbi:Uncharacterized protein BP5553_08824 [Venustampulla echinocandica]|uniref:Azaphilone pigments biosynthesis cluster protein L N-terminal domain-containing protein n=1 Tax=Venustampulla echinocandica TaxID=2656787 RepID=A0A370TD17_9HELO|nr:Uncharacterized protein BP5553_08824 [Venustampulla echinocandica]RDL32368.1 Uncharacterized protein BP5553_08824 [Venustampulla echinocandica]